MSLIPGVDVQQLRSAIQDEYAEVATQPEKGFHFHTGRRLAAVLGYDVSETASLPDAVIESFAGVGNPFVFGRLQAGEMVVEIGSGAGFDAVLAARQVGPTGQVIGVDMTPAMIEKARANAERLGLTNVEFRTGYIEELPVDDASVDVVISNGAINLSPEKEAVFREIARVLKPGGRARQSRNCPRDEPGVLKLAAHDEALPAERCRPVLVAVGADRAVHQCGDHVLEHLWITMFPPPTTPRFEQPGLWQNCPRGSINGLQMTKCEGCVTWNA